MNPKTVLKLKSYDNPARIKELWLAQYAKLGEAHPEKRELLELLVKRVELAYKDVLANKDDDEALEGDFPLGNPHDAEFMTPFFDIESLAKMQCGFSSEIKKGYFVEPAYDVLVRNGILYELEGDLENAIRCYAGDSYSRAVQEREYECRRKLEAMKNGK